MNTGRDTTSTSSGNDPSSREQNATDTNNSAFLREHPRIATNRAPDKRQPLPRAPLAPTPPTLPPSLSPGFRPSSTLRKKSFGIPLQSDSPKQPDSPRSARCYIR